MYKFNEIEEAIEDIKNGRMVIVVDDPKRENEGDLVMAGQLVRGEDINFMAQYARGLICTPCSGRILDSLDIEAMVEDNTDSYETAFTVSIDHLDTTTGISAYERAQTIRALLKAETAKEFRRPGHVFPLRGKEAGVLERLGHTEASLDLCRLAGLEELAVICEIMREDGHMARLDDLMDFREEHGLKIITIEDLVKYRQAREKRLERVTSCKLPTVYGDFKVYGYLDKITGEEHIALVMGDVEGKGILTRIHSECLTGDALGSRKCDCGAQYREAMKRIAQEGRGVLVYLRQEGRGIGLINKLRAYDLQDQGLDTVDANLELGLPVDSRNYSLAADIYKDLGIESVRLMTNNQDKLRGIEESGIKVDERIGLLVGKNRDNEYYLRTKFERMNHILEEV